MSGGTDVVGSVIMIERKQSDIGRKVIYRVHSNAKAEASRASTRPTPTASEPAQSKRATETSALTRFRRLGAASPPQVATGTKASS
jgi:ribosomal protein L4